MFKIGMFSSLSFYKYTGIAIVICGILLVIFGLRTEVKSLKTQLSSKQVELMECSNKNLQLQQIIEESTKKEDELTKKLEESKAVQTKIKQTYEDQLNKLRTQKIPSTCNEAIKFSIDNKDDLKW